MRAWLMLGGAALVSTFLLMAGALAFFSPRRYLVLNDWLTRAHRWGAQPRPESDSTPSLSWKVTGLFLFAGGIIFGGTLVFRALGVPLLPVSPAPGDTTGSSFLLWSGLAIAVLGFYVMVKPRGFVRVILRGIHQSYLDHLDRAAQNKLWGIRAFGVLLVLLGVYAMSIWLRS